MRRWTEQEVDWLSANYPTVGLIASAKHLRRTSPSIRQKACDLGLRLDPESPFFREWQSRAAASKVGKKRPDQSLVMKRLHAEGKLNRSGDPERLREWMRNNPHPRGMAGKKHTEETKARLSAMSRKMWRLKSDEDVEEILKKSAATRKKNGTKPPRSREKATWKAGWREVGGKRCYFRSRWEANYARYLQWLVDQGEIKGWEYEPETFWFENIKRGVRSYLPDFRITENDGRQVYHEVKGWMDSRSRTTLKRMKKYYPDVPLVLIDSKIYKAIQRDVRAIVPDWEIG